MAHGIERVQRGQRVLENRANLAATNLAHLVLVQIVDALAFQQDLTAADATGGIEQTNNGGTRQGFAGTGLPHHSQHFTGGDGKGHMIQGLEHTTPGREFDTQVLDS
ncbi:hypothetical protein IscW_ISCW009209 [Ixodes scapularis]|uniref:Uncharacterized protein n=1 Tax=Ixodes scapularis TaxID=6945 RepID=B7Q1C5_IXOSC|nr:hypothetical protein IscW_ISCW009209 [Ixodes scapularis]|eukprot:XP_002409313.1 hypothetical protein IscW_ISCW009209 [Ixodes scapularis]